MSMKHGGGGGGDASGIDSISPRLGTLGSAATIGAFCAGVWFAVKFPVLTIVAVGFAALLVIATGCTNPIENPIVGLLALGFGAYLGTRARNTDKGDTK